MRNALLTLMLASVLVTPADAANVAAMRSRLIGSLWAGQQGEPPATVALLLQAMAGDPDLAATVLAHAGEEQRALTHEVLSTLSWSEPEAREQLPDLYVVRSTSPPPDERPPTWSDLQWEGLALLRAIAPGDTGRDARRERNLDEALEQMPYRRPAEVAGLVRLWEAWWADRGDDASLYLDASEMPTVDAWWDEFTADEDSSAVLRMLPRLLDDPLRRRLFVARLDPDEHAHLVAETIGIVKLYQPEFVERGLPAPQWNPDRGRMEGYHAEDLRGVALQILDHVTRHLGSGADENARITDWLSWWRTARMQARYYRDPLRSPTFDPWLGGLEKPPAEGGRTMAAFLHDAYVAEGIRLLLLERLGTAQSDIVAELVHWLRKDQAAAQVDGFEFVIRRFPIRPRYQETGELMGIPWTAVQHMIRDMLSAITGVEGLPENDLPQDQLDAFWFDWWRYHEGEPQWYRGTPPQEPRQRFEPERAPRSG